MFEPVNYNMPPIDNKVTTVKRHKKSVMENISDKISDTVKKMKASAKSADENEKGKGGAAWLKQNR